MWRKLLSRAHPDSGGEHELFIWTTALHQHHCHDGMEDARTNEERRRPPPHPGPSSRPGERIDFARAFDVAASFEGLTGRILAFAEEAAEPYRTLLSQVADCYPAQAGPLYRAQHRGATYKQLAYVAHLCGMGHAERMAWYEVAAGLPLSQRHAGHLIAKLKREAA